MSQLSNYTEYPNFDENDNEENFFELDVMSQLSNCTEYPVPDDNENEEYFLGTNYTTDLIFDIEHMDDDNSTELQRLETPHGREYNKQEKRYPAIELNGFIFAVTNFRPYIDGAETTIITDHSPLKALLYRTNLQRRHGKYQIILQEYNVTIVYRPGKMNVVADALSRHHPLINAKYTI